MSDWFFDDGSATTLLQQDIFAAGVEMLGAWEGATSSATTAQYGTTQNDDGSTTVDGVVVTVPGFDFGSGTSGGVGGWEWLELTDSITPGEDGLDQPPPRPEDWDNCQDREADDLAKAIKDAIQQQSDADRREYGSLIYRDADGNLRSTPVAGGTNDMWTPLNSNSQPSDFGLTSWDQVVGIVHSHPTLREVVNPDGSVSYVEVSPADGHHLPSTGDWAWADHMVNVFGADASNFRIYLVHNGQVHEYDYYANQPGSGDRQNPAVNTAPGCGD